MMSSLSIFGSSRLRQLISWRPASYRTDHFGAALVRGLPTRQEFAALPSPLRCVALGLVALIGLAGSLTLFGIIAVELSASDLSWFESAARPDATAERPGEQVYGYITSRPVFARNRQAQTLVADAPPTSVPVVATLDQNIVLKGVFISDPFVKAFLTTPSNPVGSWFKRNDDISGWTLVDIGPERVTLQGQGEKLILNLSTTSK